jgi:hypothetical protein
MTTTRTIAEWVEVTRKALGRCATKLENFDDDIKSILGLSGDGDYSFIIDSYYLFEDTDLALEEIRKSGVGSFDDRHNFGSVYLRFYGFMAACYLQQQAAIACVKTLDLTIDLHGVKNSPIIELRNDFAAHAPNRGSGSNQHSFILDRFGLLEGKVAGYSSNAPGGFLSRDAKIDELISLWDVTFLEVLGAISADVIGKVEKHELSD